MKVILVLLFTCISLFAQETFLKYYSGYGNVTAAIIIPEQGFAMAAFTGSKVTIIKTDKHGEIEWTRAFESITAPDIILGSDGDLICLATYTSGSPSRKSPVLRKYSAEGTLIKKKVIYTGTDISALKVTEARDRGLLITGTRWIKLDQNDEIQWDIEPWMPNVLNLSTDIEGKYIMTSFYSMGRMDESGSQIWLKTLPFSGANKILVWENILISGINYVAEVNLNGELVKQKAVKGNHQICGSGEGGYFLANQQHLIKLSGTLDSLWSAPLNLTFNPVGIGLTSDSCIYLAGGNAWQMKIGTNGNYNSLILKKPSAQDKLSPDSTFTIEWQSNLSGSINILYSSDDKNTWHNIQENIPNTGKYQWQVPAEYGDFYLMMSSVEYSYLHSVSQRFQVTFNQPNDYININQIKMWTRNDGFGSYDPSGGSGFYWPADKNLTSIFADGLVWTCVVDGILHSNACWFRVGLTPGKIDYNGAPDDSTSFKYNVWKIRKNYESIPESVLKKQLSYNYQYWPGDLGAPFKDVNGDGIFTRGVDQPEFSGDEVLWYTSSDLDSSKVKRIYGSSPVGLEVQTTIFGYDRNDDLQDVVFKKYKFINCSGRIFEDMYIGHKIDPDLGDAYDDFVGCDTILNLGYAYNGDNFDNGYYGENPPALGYQILQGPVVPSGYGDSARFNGMWIHSVRNLPLTSFNLFIGAHPIYDEIPFRFEGTAMLKNLQLGKTRWGDDLKDPNTGLVTKYAVPGDPETGTGWYEGAGWPGGDASGERRMQINTGPFTMAPGDTQEVVFAIIMARGSSNLNSITELKRKAKFVQEFYNTSIFTGVQSEGIIKPGYELAQNYPNPFNPSTTIRYSIAEKSFVEMSVYDILGKKVMTLVNDERPAGEYQVRFNAHNLSSGVYYYQLRAGEYVQVRKMILIK